MDPSDLQQAVAALLAATRPNDDRIDAAVAAQKEIATHAATVDRPTLNLLLGQLSEALAEPEVKHPAVLGLACLALVEQGGNPRIPLDPLLRRLRVAVHMGRAFLQRCRRVAADQNISDEEALELIGPDLLEAHPDETWAWRGLPYLCQSVTALLNQTPQAAARFKAHAALLPEFTLLLEKCSDLLPPPVHELHALLQVLSDPQAAVTAILDPSASGALAVGGCKFFEYLSPSLTPEVRDECLRRLAAGLLDPKLLFPALLTRTAEVLVETGGDPEIVFHPFITRLAQVLDQALAFVELCREEVESDDDSDPDDEELIALALPQLRQRFPVETFAWNGLGSMCQSLMTFVAGDIEARRKARAHPRLMQQLQMLDEVREWGELQHLRFLRLALRVLDDEELIVLHVGQKKGFRVRIGGILTLGQLNVLLAGALIGAPAAGWLEGEPLDPQVVAAARDQVVEPEHDKVLCRFDLIAWHGLRCEGVVDLQNLLFCADAPAEIPLFEGTRVLLLRDPWTKQHWNANRVLECMRAWLDVTATLSPDEYEAWVARLTRKPATEA